MQAPVLVKAIPDQVVNELAAYPVFDLKEYIQTPEGGPAPRFTAVLASGEGLPKGLICMGDGVITGIPARHTQGSYRVIVTAENDAGSIEVLIPFEIKLSNNTAGSPYLDDLKSQAWEALVKQLPIPDLSELYDRPFTAMDFYYLMERWAMIKIWDADNLKPPGEKVVLNLKGASKHYVVYDRGSCLVAGPADLYSHERTLEDGLKTARAMAGEAFKREWSMELVGFYKLTRAAWVELQVLGDQYGRRPDVINFTPSLEELKAYSAKSESLQMTGRME
jgi:hypothetical protein